ncbi:hypothetical protein U1Q18_033214 [Sarracenia purpurea var. burkii]
MPKGEVSVKRARNLTEGDPFRVVPRTHVKPSQAALRSQSILNRTGRRCIDYDGARGQLLTDSKLIPYPTVLGRAGRDVSDEYLQ